MSSSCWPRHNIVFCAFYLFCWSDGTSFLYSNHTCLYTHLLIACKHGGSLEVHKGLWGSMCLWHRTFLKLELAIILCQHQFLEFQLICDDWLRCPFWLSKHLFRENRYQVIFVVYKRTNDLTVFPFFIISWHGLRNCLCFYMRFTKWFLTNPPTPGVWNTYGPIL